jgi:hypothetical protein
VCLKQEKRVANETGQVTPLLVERHANIMAIGTSSHLPDPMIHHSVPMLSEEGEAEHAAWMFHDL